MKQTGRGTILTAAVVIVAMSLTPSMANTISDNDATKVLALSKKLGEFHHDVSQLILSVLTSVSESGGFLAPENREGRQAYVCMDRLLGHTALLERNVYGAMVAVEMSAALNDALDEKLTLEVVRLTLATTSNSIAGHRSAANAMMGGCARNSPLSYDKTKAFMALVDETSKLVTPMLRRVEKAIKEN